MASLQRRQLLKTCKSALDSFIASNSKFRVVSTIRGDSISFEKLPHQQPRTLFILDSSYNPPSRAHASLVTSAISASSSTAGDKHKPTNKLYPDPVRLLLLFSTHNADKEAKPAAFEHRLAMMVVFAQDLSRDSAASAAVDIDIGLTTEPYYHAKSAAIVAASTAPTGPHPQHVHLTGYDTITRIFDPKYYAGHSPPLAALTPFFAHHAFRVTVRPPPPADAHDRAASAAETQTQLRWPAEHLASGALEAQGGARAWSERVEMVEPAAEGWDVSSTRAREAVRRRDGRELEVCCTPGVVAWIREFGLYEDGAD